MNLNRATWLTALLSTCSLALAACDQPQQMKSSDFIGIYRSTKSCGSEVLHLLPGGKYEMEFIAPSGDKKSNSGTWVYDAGQHRMEFLDFRFGHRTSNECSGFPPTEHRGVWQPDVDRTWSGSIYFEFDVDLYDGYVKED